MGLFRFNVFPSYAHLFMCHLFMCYINWYYEYVYIDNVEIYLINMRRYSL